MTVLYLWLYMMRSFTPPQLDIVCYWVSFIGW